MRLKNSILILKISFLLTIFGAATFYLQYNSCKKAYCVSSSKNQSSDQSSDDLPLSEEEESENEKSSTEEEEDDDRAIHHLSVESELSHQFTIALSSIQRLDFKEIHFEIVTPPPQA